jgi:23S rRNA (cytosine1962-C5)-methyltransferase
MSESEIILKKGREKSVLRKHPWIYSGAIEKVINGANGGEPIRVLSADRKFLAWASYNPKSQISARIWSWNENQRVNPEYLFERINNAFNFRKSILPITNSTAARVVYSESDGIPGFILDQYGEFLVIQISSIAAEYWKNDLIDICKQITGVINIYERSDLEIRKLEGLSSHQGSLSGSEPPEKIQIIENEIHYQIDIINGQKTGFFLDQRANRLRIRDYATGKKVMNCFCYTGGFSLNALLAGAEHVISIDSSKQAISLAIKNQELNDFSDRKVSWIMGDVFKELRLFRDQGDKFDLIVLDPPKFAPTNRSLEKANRAYKDINLLAFKLLNPGGILFTFSCSGGVSSDLFQKIVFGSALDAGAEVQILEKLHQDLDHPILLNFPESEYLKGLVCRVV